MRYRSERHSGVQSTLTVHLTLEKDYMGRLWMLNNFTISLLDIYSKYK
jgi:hypothetical protein